MFGADVIKLLWLSGFKIETHILKACLLDGLKRQAKWLHRRGGEIEERIHDFADKITLYNSKDSKTSAAGVRAHDISIIYFELIFTYFIPNRPTNLSEFSKLWMSLAPFINFAWIGMKFEDLLKLADLLRDASLPIQATAMLSLRDGEIAKVRRTIRLISLLIRRWFVSFKKYYSLEKGYHFENDYSRDYADFLNIIKGLIIIFAPPALPIVIKILLSEDLRWDLDSRVFECLRKLRDPDFLSQLTEATKPLVSSGHSAP